MMSRSRISPVAVAATLVTVVGSALGAYTTYTSARWPNASATFQVNANSANYPNSGVSPSAFVAAVQVGMNVWNTQSGSAMRFNLSSTPTSANSLSNDGVNAVFFRVESGGAIASNYTWWDGNNRIIDSDIVFWGDRAFVAGDSPCSSSYWVEDVAAHELGHAMGLDHSPDADATMYPSVGACSQAFRTLAPDDIAGARALYPGSAPSNTAPTVTISGPSNGATFTDGATITFAGSAFDSQDGNLTSQLQWTANGSAIGSGGLFTRTLPIGTHNITAYVNDSGGLQGSRNVSITVAAASSGGGGGSTGPTLTARGRKSRGFQIVDLSWNGLSSSSLDVYRNGSRVLVTANDGSHTDSLNRKGAGSYSYQVCAVGTSTCSNTAQVTF